MPTIRTRQEPWRDVEVPDHEVTTLGRLGLLLPEHEYPEAAVAPTAVPAATAPAPAPIRAPRGAQTPSEG